MSWGPLRFVDSMNVFPTSLASMIDDLRPRAAAAHSDGLSASKTASQTAADALRPGAGVGLHPAQAAHALRALLRRRGVGDGRGVGAALLRQRAAVSAEDHRLAVNTANVMGWETFREFHDCYLHTDVLALADVMESYRDSFRAQSGLDPIHYVTLPGAAWDAMLRHSARETPIHLITDEQAYRDVRASVMGGLSCIFQPFAQANNPELGEEDYNPEEPVSWISYLDFNAMYPAAMTLPMPNGPCVAVALPEDNAARLSWLHETCLSSLNWESDAEEVSYLLLVDYDFPPELHDHLDWAPPARMKVGKGLYGPHTADCEKLVPFLGMHVEEGVDGKRLKFLRDVLGARVWRLHRAYRFACSPFMAGFMELKHSERRQLKTAGSVVAEKVVKLTQNAIFGRCCMNPDKFRNTNAYVDPAKFERAVGKSSVTNFELQINDSAGLRGDAQDGPQQGLHERAHPSRRPHAAALQAHDGEGLLPPHEEALPEDEAALHGHRLRDGADLRAAGPAPRHGRGEPERRRPLRRGRQVQGPREGPERALCSGARQGHRGDGPAGQARRRDLPRQDPGVRGPALQDVQHPHGPARRRAQGEAQDQGRAEEGGDQRPASRVPGGAGGRQRAQGGLRAAAQPRARDSRGDRREEVALPLQRQGLRPRRSQLAAAGALAQPGAAADAGRLRSARVCALRPRDGVPRGAPASGARSDTAAAAEPLLGVDYRSLKKRKIPSSRFLVFSLSRFLNDFEPPQLLKEMTSSAAFRCVQAWLLEKPAAWADEDAPCLAAALMAQRPPCDMQRKRPREDALLEAERSHQRHLIAQLDWELLGETQCRMELERENRNLRRRVGGLNDIIDRDRERARLRIEELEHSNRILRLRLAHLG